MSASGEKQTPKNRTYTVDSGEFQTIRIGNMIRISRKSFEDWLGMEENEE